MCCNKNNLIDDDVEKRLFLFLTKFLGLEQNFGFAFV